MVDIKVPYFQITVWRVEVTLGPALLKNYLSGGSEDLVVHEDHDRQRDVEGEEGGVDLVAEVLTDQAMFPFIPGNAIC